MTLKYSIKCLAATGALIMGGCMVETESPKEIIPDFQNDDGASVEWRTGIFKGNEITYMVGENGEFVFQGDILIDPSQLEDPALQKGSLAGRNNTDYRWPSNIMYYEIDPSLYGDSRIHAAMQEIASKTNISFVQRSSQNDWVRFSTSPDKCQSYLGKKGGMQDIKIASWCPTGTVMHEIYHALGVFHEHTRQDRDSHIQINWNNIKEDWKSQYRMYTSPYYKFYGIGFDGSFHGFDYEGFDFNSIMLYGSKASSTVAVNPNIPVMTRLDGTEWESQRSYLTENDIKGINAMYPPLWQELTGEARDIGVGANGSVWIIGYGSADGGYKIYNRNGNSWTQISGGATRIDVDPSGTPWIVNNAGKIYRRNGSNWQQMPGAATDIGIGSNGSVWIIGASTTDGGYKIYNWNGSGWTQVSGGATRITVDNNGVPYIVNNVGKIYKRVGNSWQQMTGTARDIGAGASGVLYCLGTTSASGGYEVYQWVGADWMAIPGGGVSIDVGPTGIPWMTNSSGKIYTK